MYFLKYKKTADYHVIVVKEDRYFPAFTSEHVQCYDLVRVVGMEEEFHRNTISDSECIMYIFMINFDLVREAARAAAIASDPKKAENFHELVMINSAHYHAFVREKEGDAEFQQFPEDHRLPRSSSHAEEFEKSRWTSCLSY